MVSGEGRMGDKRVIRGGSWNDNARNCRAANRNANDPSNRNHNLGFRFVRAQRGDGCRFTDPVLILSGFGRRTLCRPRCVSRSTASSKRSPWVTFSPRGPST